MVPTHRLTIDGEHYVLLREREFERLCKEAKGLTKEERLPALPPPDRNGRLPALSYARRSLARNIIQARRGADLSQTELAKHARIRPETLARIEGGDYSTAPKMVDKIMKAIASVSTDRHTKKAR